MKNFYILTDALEYIEENICEDIDSQMIADSCHVSLSSLQKLFRIALRKSIKEYINKRRMCLAAKDILHTDMKFIDIAYKYQFSSPESFTRAFCKVWNETPSSYEKHWKFSGIFPKINYEYKEGADEIMAYKNVDISEAYDVFRELKGSYVICFDMIGLEKINDLSRDAGDLAIIEMCKRIDEVSTKNMLQLRIGGDEFALITGFYDLEQAKNLAAKILVHNEEPILWKKQEIPVAIRADYTKIPEKNLRYSEFFTDMHNTIEKCKSHESLEDTARIMDSIPSKVEKNN